MSQERWWEIKYDIDRYGMYEASKGVPRYPLTILVHGTHAQAETIADHLSNFEAGCDDIFYVTAYSDGTELR